MISPCFASTYCTQGLSLGPTAMPTGRNAERIPTRRKPPRPSASRHCELPFFCFQAIDQARHSCCDRRLARRHAWPARRAATAARRCAGGWICGADARYACAGVGGGGRRTSTRGAAREKEQLGHRRAARRPRVRRSARWRRECTLSLRVSPAAPPLLGREPPAARVRETAAEKLLSLL